MKILYVNTTGVLGGAELCLLDVLASLRAARPEWRPRVMLGQGGPLCDELDALGVPYDLLPVPEDLARVGDSMLRGRAAARIELAARGPLAAANAAGYVARLRRAIKRLAPDLVQTISMKGHALGTWATPRRVPVLWHLHDYLGPRLVMARLLRLLARPGVSVAGVSQSVADDAARALPSVPVRTVYNAVDLDRFAPGPGDAAALDALAGLPSAPAGTLRIGLVAAFARWKGQEVFLDALARLPADAPWRFYVVGGPLYRAPTSQYSLEELAEAARARGLEGRVGFTGHHPDPAAALRALDVVVHASTRPEPFGRVIAEGMACGRPVIAARAGGAAELFDDGHEAIGCPPGDAGALAGAIARLAGDAGLRRRLGEAGRSAAVARFNRRELADRWIPIYENAGAPRRDGRGRPPESRGQRVAQPS